MRRNQFEFQFLTTNNIMHEPTYTDIDLMPFGKYKNQPIADVPVNYLHWLWQQKPLSNQRLHNYILNNLDALKLENKDLIWS